MVGLSGDGFAVCFCLGSMYKQARRHGQWGLARKVVWLQPTFFAHYVNKHGVCMAVCWGVVGLLRGIASETGTLLGMGAFRKIYAYRCEG